MKMEVTTEFDDIVIIVPSLNPDEAIVEVVKSVADAGIKNIWL